MNNFKGLIFEHIQQLDDYICKNDWKAYDPFDGLNAKVLSRLTFDNHYLKIILQQSVRRFPVNLRPFFGIQKETSTKGMGFCALGYLKLYQATGKEGYLEKLRFCLDWLRRNFSRGYSGYSWGNHFNYEARGGSIPLNVPTIVWTALVANVFLDAFEALGEQKYFEIAKSCGDFIVNDIGRYKDSDGTICFMYTPQNEIQPSLGSWIHNSNVLGAWLLARLYKFTKEEDIFAIAKSAIAFTAKHQLQNGGWYYGVQKKFRWIDSYHTGYVLESLYGYLKATGDESYKENMNRGYKYFISTFFRKDGTPRYYHYKTYPIDIQCASQGIQTLVTLKELNSSSLELAKKVSQWTIQEMQDRKGFFYFRKYPLATNKTPTFHWGQATMLAALAALYKEMNESGISFYSNVVGQSSSQCK